MKYKRSKLYPVTTNLREILEKDFPRMKLKEDSEMMMYESGASLVGLSKIDTVRYKNGVIRYPSAEPIPFILTRENDKNYRKQEGNILVPSMTVKRLGEITEEDAIRDGCRNKAELIGELVMIYEPIYGPVSLDHLVSIYRDVVRVQ